MESTTQQAAEEFLQKLLAEMSPAAGPLREVVQNILHRKIECVK